MHARLLLAAGDAVLGLVATLWSYREGGSAEDMTLRVHLTVNNSALAEAACRAGLHRHAMLGSGLLAAAVARFAGAVQAAGGRVVSKYTAKQVCARCAVFCGAVLWPWRW